MLLKPNVPKIKTVLSFIDRRAKEFSLSPLTNSQVYAVMFYSDVIHLNKHGRPITFDTYRTTVNGVEAFCASKYIGRELEYDWDQMSVSDEDTIIDSLSIHAEISLRDLVEDVKNHHAYLVAQAKGAYPQIIELKDMFVHTLNKVQRDEQLWLIETTNANMTDNDFDMSQIKDIKSWN